MVSYQAPPVYGGAGQQAVAIALALGAENVSTTLLTCNQAGAARREELGRLTIRRLPIDGLVRRFSGRWTRAIRTAGFVAWQVAHLARHPYDVYHVHGSYWWSLPAAVVSRLRRRPLVVKITRQGEDDAETVAAKRMFGIGVGRLYSYPMRRATAVIALNDEVASGVRSTLPGVSPVEFPNGVDVDRFAPAPEKRSAIRRELGIAVDAVMVLFVGYLAPVKGVRTLIEAWAATVKPSSALLVLAGPDSGVYRELDQDLVGWVADHERTDPSIRRLGHVEQDDVLRLYQAADLFVLPSLAEGMPNSLLEALACGLPCVASDIAGSRDILRGSGAGWLAPPGDAGALAKVIETGMRESAWAAQQARPWVEARYSLAAVARQYRGLYEHSQDSEWIARRQVKGQDDVATG